MRTYGFRGRPRRQAEIGLWDTRDPLPTVFRDAWDAALRSSPHAHFAVDLDYLVWEGSHDRHARALLLEGAGRRGVMVQRFTGGRWVSGWPWRWQALMCDADPSSPLGMTAADARWLHEQAAQVAGARDFVTHLPHAPLQGIAGWPAGATVLQDLGRSDDEIFEGMEPSKRRLLRRARSHEIEVAGVPAPGDALAFHRLQQEWRTRMRLPTGPTPLRVDRPGDAWREWELPWMWLLVARRGGEVVAGVGSGVRSPGTLQGRAAASTLEGRRLGATVLLGYEEARLGRDRGHRWFNHGGDTPFKREMSGRLGRSIRVHGWIGGARSRTWWHHGEAVLRNVRPVVARVRRRLRLGSGWAGVFVKVAALLLPLAADFATGS
jgi:hypothetical protein